MLHKPFYNIHNILYLWTVLLLFDAYHSRNNNDWAERAVRQRRHEIQKLLWAHVHFFNQTKTKQYSLDSPYKI